MMQSYEKLRSQEVLHLPSCDVCFVWQTSYSAEGQTVKGMIELDFGCELGESCLLSLCDFHCDEHQRAKQTEHTGHYSLSWITVASEDYHRS